MSNKFDSLVANLRNVIVSPSIESVDKVFHYPAVIMDTVSFVPASNNSEIVSFFSNFKTSFLDKLQYQLVTHKRVESEDLSKTLRSAKITWEFYDNRQCPLYSTTFSMSLIDVDDALKIVVLELNNAPLHESSNLKTKKAEFDRISAQREARV